MVDANIDIFKISYEESVSYVKCLENLENIRRTKITSLASLPLYDKKSVTSRIGKSSKNDKGSKMWYQPQHG
jgi:hypothetical protein